MWNRKLQPLRKNGKREKINDFGPVLCISHWRCVLKHFINHRWTYKGLLRICVVFHGLYWGQIFKYLFWLSSNLFLKSHFGSLVIEFFYRILMLSPSLRSKHRILGNVAVLIENDIIAEPKLHCAHIWMASSFLINIFYYIHILNICIHIHVPHHTVKTDDWTRC